MGIIATLICGSGLLAGAALAQTRPTAPVTLTVDTASRGYAIPQGFSGLSFERGPLNSNNAGVSGYFFSPSNTQLVTLFQNLSLHNLRIGGGSVDQAVPAGYNPDGFTGIDDLFEFAQVAGAKVIYSVRMLNTRNTYPNLKAQDANIASHIWQRNASLLDSFAIGNEPDWHNPYHTRGDPAIFETTPGVPGSAYPSFLADWRSFASTIVDSVPAAVFVAPETGSYTTSTYTPDPTTGVSWTQQFAQDEKDAKNAAGAPLLVAATQHHYVGGSPGKTTTQEAIDNMLSRNWVNDTEITKGPEGTETYTPYPWIYMHNLEPVLKNGVAYRMTEANDVLTGIAGASNGYAASLWALDYMHWWAEHGMAGVNFHNKQWILTDTIVPGAYPCSGPCTNFQTTPKGYGIKAFDLGGHGFTKTVTITNPNNVNVTAYATGNAREIYVTIINKTHNSANDSTDAVVTIHPNGFAAASATEMVLTDGDPGNAALMNASLGGAVITNNSRWLGQWAPLQPESDGEVTVTVPATTAAVVRIRAAGNYAGPIQTNQNGALEVFATRAPGNGYHLGNGQAQGSSGQGDIWHNSQKSANVPDSQASSWNGWADLGGGVASQGGAAVVRNLNNTFEIFVPSTAGDVYHNYQLTPGGAWSGWIDMGASSNGITSLQAANNADGSISVFGVGQDGGLWYASQNAPGVGWSNWTELNGQVIEPGFVVGENLNGLLQVFGADSRGNVWYNSQTSSGAWSGWNSLPGQVINPQLAIARNLGGRLEVFGVGSNGDVWHNWQTSPGGTWNGWSDIAGKQLQPGFVAGQNKDGRLVLFGVQGPAPANGNGQNDLGPVWSLSQQAPGTNFSGDWVSLGGNVDPQLVVGNTADGRVQLFGTGVNQDIWSNWQQASGDWAGWSDFGGKGLKFYARPTK